MKFLSVMIVFASLSSSAFAAGSVTGSGQVHKSINPYSAEASAPLAASASHDAKIAALTNAMDQCHSEAVRRTDDWSVTNDIKRPNCLPNYGDSCGGGMDGNIEVTVAAHATFECLDGKTPDLN